MKTLHSLKIVCQRTGLSPQLVRTWEKRYAAVTPARTDTHRRLYSEEEIVRLDLLHRLTKKGHAISRIANLPESGLSGLLAGAASPPKPAANASPQEDSDFFADMFAAIELLDTSALLDHLRRAVLQRGHSWVLEHIAGLADQIGERWRSGTLRVAHEHLATAALRIFLGGFIQDSNPEVSAPLLLVCTPAGQYHDLGAVLAGAAACTVGWRVTFLGASLPSEEIAAAALTVHARAVALSIVYPADDPNLPRELEKLRRLLPSGIPILIGGRSALPYRACLEKIGALPVNSLSGLQQLLDGIRR